MSKFEFKCRFCNRVYKCESQYDVPILRCEDGGNCQLIKTKGPTTYVARRRRGSDWKGELMTLAKTMVSLKTLSERKKLLNEIEINLQENYVVLHKK